MRGRPYARGLRPARRLRASALPARASPLARGSVLAHLQRRGGARPHLAGRRERSLEGQKTQHKR